MPPVINISFSVNEKTHRHSWYIMLFSYVLIDFLA